MKGIGALLRLFDRLRQTVNAVFNFRKLRGEVLDLVETAVRVIQHGIGGMKAVINILLCFADRYRRQLHAHNAAEINGKALIHRDGLRKGRAHAQGYIRPLQGSIRLRIGAVDPVLNLVCLIDHQHHLAHQDVALSVQQVIAELGKVQRLAGAD